MNLNPESYVWVLGAEKWGVQDTQKTEVRRRDKLHTETYRGISPLGRQYSDRSKASQMAEERTLYRKYLP
jgi:hypothetical protein